MGTSSIKLFIISLVSFSLLIVLMMFSGNKQAQAIEEDKMLAIENARVDVFSVELVDEYVRKRTVFGQIQAGQQADIGFERSGAIQALLVEDGDSVVQGQVLAKMDTARLQAQKAELDAALNRARADARLAALSRDRVADLVKSKLEPKQRLDEEDARLDASNALVSEVLARLNTLNVELEKSQLRAPFDGQIINQYQDAGAVVNAGQGIFMIMDKNALEAKFGLPEKTAFQLQQARQFELRINDRSVLAKLKTISKTRNTATRTLDAIFAIQPDDKAQIVSGDIVSLSVELPYQKTGAWVPLSALANGIRGMWTLMVLNENESTLGARLVIVEHIEGEKVFVSGAIATGDKVVTSGIHRLTPGQKVSSVTEIPASQIIANYRSYQP